MNEELKIIISANIKQFQQSLEKARSEVESLRQKTGTADTALGRMSAASQKTGTELVRLKQNSSNLAAEQSKVENSMDGVESSAKKYASTSIKLNRTIAEGSSELGAWSIIGGKAAQIIAKIAPNLAPTISSFDKLQVELKESAQQLEKAKAKYKELLASQNATTEQLKKQQQEIKAASKAFEALRKALEKVEKEAEDAEKSLADYQDEIGRAAQVSNRVLAGMGAAVLAFGAALIASSKASLEFRKNQAKLVTSFEIAGSSAETAKQVYKDLYRVLGDDGQATEAAQHLAKLTTNEKELEQWTKITQGAYAQFGDSLPIESLAEAANETAKTGELTGGLTDALVWAGVAEEDFAAKLLECNSEAEREKLIRETLLGLYGSAAEQYEQTGASVMQQYEAELKLQEANAKLGEAMTPVLAALTEMAAVIMERVSPAIAEFIDAHGETLTDTLIGIADAIGAVIGWIVDNWNWISAIAGAVTAVAIAVSLLSAGIAAYNAVMAIATVLSAPVLVTVGLVVAAIGALVAIIILCINYWDEIAAAASASWNWIKDAWSAAGSWFSNYVLKPIGNFFVSMWNGLVSGAKAAWNGIKTVFSVVGNFFGDVFSAAWNRVKLVFSVGGAIFKGITEGISKAFKAIVNSLITGINAVVSAPFSAINAILGKIRGASIAGIQPFKGLGTISVPKIPYLAKGGIVDDATLAMIGEQGREAVVPLENNTEWIDTLVNKLASRMGGQGDIILKVNERELGRASARGINGITKQTGSMPLVFA